jgi:cytidylate kinase
MIIAIDGPSGVGKSTLAKNIASYFDLQYLDTGIIYRIIGLKCIEKKVKNNNEIIKIARELTYADIIKNNFRLYNKEISESSSQIAASKIVREIVLSIQRDFCEMPFGIKQGSCLDGRDIGTKIYPITNFKFFLCANILTRAKRRFKELLSKKTVVTFKNTLKDLIKRDFRDISRHHFPLKISDNAICIDSTLANKKSISNRTFNIIKKKIIQTLFEK